MNNINDFINELEKMAYKILLLALFIPKTLLKVILDPNWVPGYIKQELSKDSNKAFDNYMSPVVLFIIVALFPAIFIKNSLSTSDYGMTFHEPKPYTEYNLRNMLFTVEAKLSQSNSKGFQNFRWEIWQVDQVDQNGNSKEIAYGYDGFHSIKYFDEMLDIVENPSFTFVYGEIHDKTNAIIPFTLSNTGEPILKHDETNKSNIQNLETSIIKDGFIIKDIFNYHFNEGEYQVRVFTEVVTPVDRFFLRDTIYITALQDISQPIYYASENMVYGEETKNFNTNTDTNIIDNFMGGLENSETYFLALGFLSLPLLFSFGTKSTNDSLSITSMKTSFYIQCYYLSTVAIVFWASIFLTASSLYSLTLIDEISILTTWISIFLILLWFLNAEVRAIKNERGISTGKAWGTFFILILILATCITLASFAVSNSDSVIQSSLKLYSIIVFGVWIAYIFKRRRERTAKKKEVVENPSPN